VKYLSNLIQCHQLANNLSIKNILTVADQYHLSELVRVCMNESITNLFEFSSNLNENKQNETFQQLCHSLSTTTKDIALEMMEQRLKVTFNIVYTLFETIHF
jgi:hypothetical protein